MLPDLFHNTALKLATLTGMPIEAVVPIFALILAVAVSALFAKVMS